MKKGIFFVLVVMCGALVLNVIENRPSYAVMPGVDSAEQAAAFASQVIEATNKTVMSVDFEGVPIEENMLTCYLSDGMQVMMPVSMLKDYLGCELSYPSDETMKLKSGTTELTFTIGSERAFVNQAEFSLTEAVIERNGIVYVPILDIGEYIHVDTAYSLVDNHLEMVSIPYEEALPDRYDMRAEGRVTPVRNQGTHGNCWAYACIGALETTLMPEEELIYSANYMSKHSGYAVEDIEGGDYTMAVAYLARWDGPVARKTDADASDNADYIEVDGREVLKHLEEAVFIGSKDYDTIKEYVYKYGGVQSSIYINMELMNEDGQSRFYNEEKAAYYFNDQETTNHDIVIVGWDDNYPKENFSIMPEGDGAFICKNSWGKKFGEAGYFYISYYDTNIGTVNTCYTVLGDLDNFDYNYQTDRLGWIGELGFDCGNAYMANVYTTHEEELLEAVAFYATDVNTSYKVYVVPEYKNEASLKLRKLVAEGSFEQAGYYTVRLENAVELAADTKYAVIVYIDTPDSVHPVAIEYAAGERTSTFDIADGEGYVSLYGESWTHVEEQQNANICLKAFTNRKERVE